MRLHLLRRCSSVARPSATQANHTIANKQLLYTTDVSSPGSIFFLPHGTRVFNKLVQFMKHQQLRHGFQEVITPLIYKTSLWETSGHWDNYKDDMFKVVGHAADADDGAEYGLKPMNCPGHCLLFAHAERSYNELPVRFSDFSSLHRNEASGALSGLTRVRRFHQDDGHIFCALHQIQREIGATVALIQDSYRVFGLAADKVDLCLSTRPAKYMGDLATWDAAEAQLVAVLDATAGAGRWRTKPGDGAFYGPKIDVLVTDAFGKKHQVGTVQLDFQLPARFGLAYVAADGSRDNRPVMVHRAVFGSLERFFAILLDHHQGRWPFWLNPRQAVVVPVAERHRAAAEAVQRRLVGDVVASDSAVAPMTGYNFHVDVDARSETVGNRIKDALQKGYSYIVMVGDKDIANGTVSVRTRDDRSVHHHTVDDLYAKFIDLEKAYQ